MADELISRQALMKKIEEEYDLNYGEILMNPREFADMVAYSPAIDAVVLPCNVGDEIYRIVKPSGACKPFIPTLPDKVEPFGICYRNVMGGYSLIPLDEFGKTVFLTREEAEAALERREENAAD